MEERDLANNGPGYAGPGRARRGPSAPYDTGAGRVSQGGSGYGAEIEVDLPSLRAPVLPEEDAAGAEPAVGAGYGTDPYSGNPYEAEPRLWPGGGVEGLMELPAVAGGPVAAQGLAASVSPVHSHSLTGVDLGSGAGGWGGGPTLRDASPVAGISGERASLPLAEVGRGRAEEASRKGISAGGAFGMALMAQFVLVGLCLAAVWAFPRETGDLIQRLFARLELTKPSSMSVARIPGGEVSAERLMILDLEDRALYRGERSALEQLQRMGRELKPEEPCFDAVQASLIRVRQSYQLSLGEVPGPLDPREILPGFETERDLPATAIVDVLRNRRQSPAKRQRAAYLLANERQSAAAQSALFHAIQDDPSLVVVRQAFQSFQELTGYPGRDFFDTDAIDRWWARNSASFMSQRAEK